MKALGYILIVVGVMNFFGALITNREFSNSIYGENSANGISRFAATCIITILLMVGGNTLIRRSKPKI
jgi:hypothetical protein